MRLSAFVLHTTAAGIMTWGWFNFLDQPIAKLIMTQKGSCFQFLTNQGLLSGWSYMIVSLFCDMLPRECRSGSRAYIAVLHLKRTLLMISMPLALVISSTYWPLLLFFPNLITPPTAVSMFPLSLDLALHASPLFTLLIDFFVFESKFSKTYVHKVAPAVCIVCCVPYAAFIEYCATFNGFFPYPFLTNSPFAARILIYTAVGGAICESILHASTRSLKSYTGSSY